MTKPKSARWVGWILAGANNAFLWTTYEDGTVLLTARVSKERMLDTDRRIEIIVREIPEKRRKP